MEFGKEHGLVLVGGEEEEIEDTKTSRAEKEKKVAKMALVSQARAEILKHAGPGILDVQLKKLSEEKQDLLDEISGVEGQLTRFKVQAETSENVEDEIKSEKRKLKRELREAQARVDELETANTHLQKRIDELKTVKNALIKACGKEIRSCK